MVVATGVVVAVLVAIAEATDTPRHVAWLLVARPRAALLVFTAWGVFVTPPVLHRRRRLLVAARSA